MSHPHPATRVTTTTPRAIEIATGSMDGAMAEVTMMIDVVSTKTTTMPLATSITDVLTTTGELSAVAAAQQTIGPNAQQDNIIRIPFFSFRCTFIKTHYVVFFL